MYRVHLDATIECDTLDECLALLEHMGREKGRRRLPSPQDVSWMVCWLDACEADGC